MFAAAIAVSVLAAEVPAPSGTTIPAALPVASAASSQDEAEAAADEAPAWTGSVTVGATFADGNTDRTSASATADAVKELEEETYTLGFQWNYTDEDGEITQRRTLARAQYDREISEKAYWLLNASVEADDQADLDLRVILGGGVGYKFKDTDTFKLSGEAGLSYFDEDYDDADDEYVAARLAAKWDWTTSERWSFAQTVEVYPSLEDADDVYSKVDTRAKATLTDDMFAQLQWLFDWDNTPSEGNDRVDHLFLLTVGWKF